MYYSASDRKALLGLVLMICATLCGLWLLHQSGHEEAVTPSAADTLRHAAPQPHSSAAISSRHPQRGGALPIADASEQSSVSQLFPFDPNTADSTALLRLGLSRWQVRNIYRYRSKGGIYRCPEDFSLLYGLSAYQYKRLLPYIRIAPDYSMSAAELTKASRQRKYLPESNQTQAPALESLSANTQPLSDPRKLKAGEYVELNHSDTSQLKRIPGIGSYFARRIVRYREELGGFVSLSQLDEIEDFPSGAKSYMRIESLTEGVSPVYRRLSVNRLSTNQLRKHPYLNFYQARAIVEYRRLEGPLQSIRELANLPEFSESDFIRLEPYISYE